MEKLIIIGAGGYSKSVIDSLNYEQYELIGFIDNYTLKETHLGYPIIASNIDDIKNANQYVYFIAIGDNKNRLRWYNKLIKRELHVISVIDKTALVSNNSRLDKGCFIGKMAIINSGVIIGENCIINTKSLVEHGCRIGSNSNVSTNAVLNGDVCIGNATFVGSSSVVNGQIKIGNNVIIGSGTVVINNVEDNVTLVGVPGRIIRKGEI